MAFLIRLVHVTAVSVIFGGALLLFLLLARRTKLGAWTLEVMRTYEWTSWAAIGVIAMTGIGNLAHFGEGLPGSSSPWGQRFTLKLALVLIILTISVIRTLSVGMLHVQTEVPARAWRSLSVLYGATAALVAGTLAVAVALAHF